MTKKSFWRFWTGEGTNIKPKLIVGLGNPGPEYAGNRHNVGFMCLRHLARTQGISLDKKQGEARTGTGTIEGQDVVLARPQTYMNASGSAVSRLVKKLKITPADIIVIHDDLDLPLGRIRLRHGGSSGGHKGIESIIAGLGNRDFHRVRVGIGRPEASGSEADKQAAVIAYVLDGMNSEEKKVIHRAVVEVSQAVICLLTEGIEAAMNRYN